MKTNHTPGPWKLGYMGRGKYSGSTGVYPDSGGPAFAVLPPGRKEIQEANARLVAAAPDLLAALKAIKDAAACCSLATAIPLAIHIAHANNIIAKAEGKES